MDFRLSVRDVRTSPPERPVPRAVTPRAKSSPASIATTGSPRKVSAELTVLVSSSTVSARVHSSMRATGKERRP